MLPEEEGSVQLMLKVREVLPTPCGELWPVLSLCFPARKVCLY